MSRERTYPDEPAGPFEEPPASFVDREGREIGVRGYPPGHEVPEALVAMYLAFDPADRAQGIPPSGEAAVRRWLEDIFRTGYNAVAWHGERAAGHATLVPEGDAGGPVAADADAGDADGAAGDDDAADAGGDAGDDAAGDAGGDASGEAVADASGDDAGEAAADAGGDAPGREGAGTDAGGGAGERRPAYELAIFVLQAYQRAGIGGRLLRALLGFGAAHGVRRVWLTVEPWNRTAIGLYRDVGFEVTSSGGLELEMALLLDADRGRGKRPG